MELRESELRQHLIGDFYYDYRNDTIVNHNFIPKSRKEPINRVVFHCTDAPHWSPERLSAFFIQERGFSICSYHYYVTADKIYHMVGDSVITPHASPFNSTSVAFSIDYYPTRDEKNNIPLSKEIYQNTLNTATYLCIKHKVEPKKAIPSYQGLVGHRELPFTGFAKDKQDNIILRKTCPGLAIDLNAFRYNVARKIQNELNANGSKLAIDGIFGPVTRKVFNDLVIT